MSRLAKKFMLGLSAILVVVVLCSLYLNSNFIERYFISEERREISRIGSELAASADIGETIARLEETQDAVIVRVKSTPDNDLLNSRLREAFLEKGLGFERFWLWEEDQKTVLESGSVMRVYGQEKLHYSLLVKYVLSGSDFIAVAKIIPAMQSTISLINVVTACIFAGATLIMLLLIFFLVKKITGPLTAIGETARAISSLDFRTVEVKTGDELEALAHDINRMSGKLQEAHRELQTQNMQMEALLTNVSHELKTPVSLIKAYTSGIRDGMDDGTFLDTIALQNEKMEHTIERLLYLSKTHRQETFVEPVDLGLILRDAVLECELQAQSRGLSFLCAAPTSLVRPANRETVLTIFSNLLSNAVKYADSGIIEITLETGDDDCCVFKIENTVNPKSKIEPERLWEPFYVAEQSRNRDMSGTGLGLSIVRTAAQKYGYDCT